MSVIVSTFYKFVTLPDCVALQSAWQVLAQEAELRGTILLATEGINGTIAAPRQTLDRALAFIRQDPRLSDLETKDSVATTQPFGRFKIKIKPEIVTFGQPIERDRVGQYVEPQDWNALIRDPEVLLIDTRNDYEYDIGTFEGAKNPNTQSFRDFPAYVQQQLDPKQHRKVAMFCTGGIRCEKATAYLRQQGFQEVYHLKGGILNYLETVPAEESLWAGECFVFDDRVAVQHGLEPGHYRLCGQCGYPVAIDVAICPDCQAEQTNETQK